MPKSVYKTEDSFRNAYPLFRKPLQLPELPQVSVVRSLTLRPNTMAVRVYSPEGFTNNGLWVEVNRKWPRIWAFVLACSKENRLNLVPGDLVVFERWCDSLIAYEYPEQEAFIGQRHSVSILHEKAVLAVIRENNIPVPL